MTKAELIEKIIDSGDTILISFALLSSSPAFVSAEPDQVYFQVFLQTPHSLTVFQYVHASAVPPLLAVTKKDPKIVIMSP